MEAPLSIFQMQHMFFPLLAICGFGFVHFYIYKALIKSFADTALFRRFWLVVVWLNFLGTAAYFSFLHKAPPSQSLYLLLSVCMGVALSFLVVTLLYQLCSLALLGIKHKHTRTRVRFTLKRIAGIAGIVMVVYGIFIGVQKPQITHISLEIDGLSAPLEVVQLSDIHIGGLIESTRVRDIVERTNALNPDVIFLTGDIVDSPIEIVREAVNELAHLRAHYGVYYVLGNHEYFHDARDILEYLRTMGFKVLLNDVDVITHEHTPIVIAGIADLVGVREAFLHHDLKPDVRQTLLKAKDTIQEATYTPVIFLSHQPKVIYELESIHNFEPELTANIRLVLSGHTHGGQIFPFSLLVPLQQPYAKGLDSLPIGGYLYINQGTGYWGPPMRVGSVNEITHFTLIPKAKP
ncbi:metallophosphoesterase [uncultured Helicobacter sp.]|uniref:metallophosphoesterase n=1 Tax=uncultured Helicobacter sp. TaxID=175537 RepID=UPI00374ECC01